MDNHNLIQRDQTFVTTRKLLSVHSDDRNLTICPESNNFSITLPAPILNVQSMQLIQCAFPSSLYVFSTNQKNTKFKITIGSTTTEVVINEGTYTDVQFVAELNRVLSSVLHINAVLSTIDRKLTFTSQSPTTSFTFNFGEKIDYSECGPNFSSRNCVEGLPYHMGFENENCTSSAVGIVHTIVSKFPINIIGESCFYMEIDKYNLLDELSPFNKSPKDPNSVVIAGQGDNMNISVVQKFSNVFLGKSNSAFAKIPLTINQSLNPFNSQFTTLCNAGFYDPAIEKISTLRFKFRYHNGALVDFKNNRFDFTIEFTSLRNEISKSFSIRKGII